MSKYEVKTGNPTSRLIAWGAAALGAGFLTQGAWAADVGPLVQFVPDTPAQASEVNDNFSDVASAVNSKQDEATAAGMDFSSASSSSFTLNTTSRTTVRTVALTVPGPGVVEVLFSARSFINHVATGSIFEGTGLDCRIEKDGTQVFGSARTWNTNGQEPTGGRNRPMTIVAAFEESAAGSLTITATCQKQGDANAQVSHPTLTAKFFEHRY